MTAAPTRHQQFFVVMASDRPGSLALRETLRPAHRRWLREHHGHDVAVIQGGPTLDREDQMNGTLLIVQALGIQHVTRFVEADPYSAGGLFADVIIRPWQWSLGRPVEDCFSPPDLPGRRRGSTLPT